MNSLKFLNPPLCYLFSLLFAMHFLPRPKLKYQCDIKVCACPSFIHDIILLMIRAITLQIILCTPRSHNTMCANLVIIRVVVFESSAKTQIHSLTQWHMSVFKNEQLKLFETFVCYLFLLLFAIYPWPWHILKHQCNIKVCTSLSFIHNISLMIMALSRILLAILLAQKCA